MSIERTQEQQYQRITAVLKGWREQTALACAAYHEAKQSECWRLHHKTWKAFIEACGFTQEWARQLAMTGERMEEMTALLTGSPDATELHSHTDLPTKVNNLTPGVRKVLDSIPLASQVEVLAQTKASVPTVKEVKAVKAKVVEPAQIQEAEVIVTDANGRTVPAGIVDAWQKATTEGNRLTKMLHEVKLAVQRGVNDDDPTFTRCHNSDVADFDRVYYKIKNDVTPHVVCTTCQGVHAKKCKHCYGTGWLTMFQWKNLAEDIRKLAEKTGRKA
jgi:hypothetical protein